MAVVIDIFLFSVYLVCVTISRVMWQLRLRVLAVRAHGLRRLDGRARGGRAAGRRRERRARAALRRRPARHRHATRRHPQVSTAPRPSAPPVGARLSNSCFACYTGHTKTWRSRPLWRRSRNTSSRSIYWPDDLSTRLREPACWSKRPMHSLTMR